MREVHSSPKSLSCKECGKTFSRNDKLNDHIKRVHSEIKPESFPCIQCEKTFTRKDNLQRHMKDSHKKEQRFECSECFDTFSRMEHLKSHEERGKHSGVLNCEYCYQDLTFKSYDAAQRHIIEHPTLPSLTTCRNVKYALGKMPTEEQKEEFEKRMHKKWFEERLKRKAETHYKECYVLSCKCGAQNETYEEFEERYMREEREREEKSRQRWAKRKYNEYDADETMIDPYSKDPIQEPVRNKECGHVYDREGFLEMTRRVDELMKGSTRPLKKGYGCYVKSCSSRILCIDDLEPDTAMAEEIEKRREKKRKEKEEKKRKETREYAERWERRKRNREEKEEEKKKKEKKKKNKNTKKGKVIKKK